MYQVQFVNLVVLFIAISCILIVSYMLQNNHNYVVFSSIEYYESKDFENFDNITGTKDGCYIVPNIVHFIRFNQENLSFIDLICILAAYKHQKPDYIYIHTNVPNFSGKYWEYLLNNTDIMDVIKIKYLEMPIEIFGQKLSRLFLVYHSSDISRLKVLMKYGGIYLDNDCYIVRNMNDLRRYEISIGWSEHDNDSIANQVIVANRNARFLKLWLETYRNNYHRHLWYYNAGIRPTQEVLVKDPSLVHREKVLLAPYYEIIRNLYLQNWTDWKNLYVIHLFINHMYAVNRNLSEKAVYPVVFNEDNIKHYPVTIRDMVDKVYQLD